MSFGNGSKVVGPGEGKTVNVLGDPYTFKASKSDTGGAYSLTEFTTIGDGPPPHIHNSAEEAFYILEGEVNVQAGESTVIGTPGAFFLIPRGVIHTFSNAGANPAKLLVIISPAGFEQFFEDVDGVSDLDKIVSAAEKHNMEIIGPPPG